MDKFLMVASVPSMIGQFNMNNIRILLDMGYEVHVACNFNDRSVWTEKRVQQFKKELKELGVKGIQIDFARTPYDIPKLIKAYNKLHRIIKQQMYKCLHCHTPVAGMIARFAARGTDTKVIYTAHGFHFFKGAPMKKWMIYYPVEKICSYMTDVLITINKEDYALACRRMKAGRVDYIPGVGVDVEKFSGKPENHIREELGIGESDTVLLSVGELNVNKNHEIVIRALAQLDFSGYYLIAGQGDLKEHLKKVVEECGLGNRVKLLGFRTDVTLLYDAADVFVFPSHREGLSVALMEAMASGLPVVCSDIRGNSDLISDKQYRFDPNDVDDVKKKINTLVNSNKDERNEIGTQNLLTMCSFDKNTVVDAIEALYGSISQIGGGGIEVGCGNLLAMLSRESLRAELGCSQEEFMLLSVGELSVRKNHQVVIRALGELKKSGMENFKYYIVGKGDLKEELERLIHEMDLDSQVTLLGFRADVKALLKAADLFVFPSLQEGLPVALMEAMASGLPCIVSNIRGNVDLIEDGVSGAIVSDKSETSSVITSLMSAPQTMKKYSDLGSKIVRMFSTSRISSFMFDIYKKLK